MKRIYTFAVIFGKYYDEIDVQARDEAEAWTKARAEANDLYGDDLDAPPAYSLKMNTVPGAPKLNRSVLGIKRKIIRQLERRPLTAEQAAIVDYAVQGMQS